MSNSQMGRQQNLAIFTFFAMLLTFLIFYSFFLDFFSFSLNENSERVYSITSCFDAVKLVILSNRNVELSQQWLLFFSFGFGLILATSLSIFNVRNIYQHKLSYNYLSYLTLGLISFLISYIPEALRVGFYFWIAASNLTSFCHILQIQSSMNSLQLGEPRFALYIKYIFLSIICVSLVIGLYFLLPFLVTFAWLLGL